MAELPLLVTVEGPCTGGRPWPPQARFSNEIFGELGIAIISRSQHQGVPLQAPLSVLRPGVTQPGGLRKTRHN
jgi:hypothetical protein